ncbi:hypothetical protein PJE062_2903 [Pseudovibrio sp. JE062]|nr:hypothetical protein PJE062_2903 [Pseudovibrio sp. JE062]
MAGQASLQVSLKASWGKHFKFAQSLRHLLQTVFTQTRESELKSLEAKHNAAKFLSSNRL